MENTTVAGHTDTLVDLDVSRGYTIFVGSDWDAFVAIIRSIRYMSALFCVAGHLIDLHDAVWASNIEDVPNNATYGRTDPNHGQMRICTGVC